MKEQYPFFSALLRTPVDASQDKFPLTREDASSESDHVADLPAISICQFPSNDAPFPVADKSSLLVGRKNDLGVKIKIALRLHRIVGKEVLFVHVDAAEPVPV